MRNITLEELLEAGCHFGHQVSRSNPKARDFVFEARDGIHIIDLAKTKEGLEEAAKFIKSVGQSPSSTLVIVGTKRQTQEILKSELERVTREIKGENGIYSVTNKWIGGLLTNFSEVSKNFKKLNDLTHKLETPSEQEGYTKKEIGQWVKEKEKLESFYGGVYKLNKKPEVLFIIDSHLEHLAVNEAMKMGVPTVAITDTNSDPFLVDYPIPANDDAVGSLQLIIGYILDAWCEGKNSVKVEKIEAKEEKKAKEAKAESKPKVKTEKTEKAEKKVSKKSSEAKATKDKEKKT
jgi:small subunit ribosomal protein S2